MKDGILFSILIANYNNSVFLNDCIQSILNQTYQNFEVIFVDDCSTDNSIEEYKRIVGSDVRFKSYTNKINKGCGYTKAKCANLATGDILAFLDPDDVLLETALMKMVEQHKIHMDVSIVSSQYYECDKHLKIHRIVTSKKKRDNFISQLDTPFSITHFASFKKEAYKKSGGIDTYMKRAVDQDLYFKMEEQGSVLFIDEPLYKYRMNNNSISLNDNNYKAIGWHMYAIMNACKRRNLDYDCYCDILKPKHIQKYALWFEKTLVNIRNFFLYFNK